MIIQRSFALACLALAFLGLPATTREKWESCASLSGLQRSLEVRRHRQCKRDVSVVFTDYMKRFHSRVVDFITQTKAMTGIQILESVRDANRKKAPPIVINGLADAFSLATCPSIDSDRGGPEAYNSTKTYLRVAKSKRIGSTSA